MSKKKPSAKGNDPSQPEDAALIAEARRQAEALDDSDLTLDAPPGDNGFIGPPPDSFTGYRIIKEVHRGGQGVVYQAVQESTSRTVAIKVLRQGPFADSSDRARFDREVQILGQLNHANIVSIHDRGTAAGCDYFVMDYVSGQPLDVYMASGERTIDESLRLFLNICDAINAAHLRGVIHRDIKPSNIRIDAEGQPHILDFGLAKTGSAGVPPASGSVGVPPPNPNIMTITGQFIGSLPWASPEQAEAIPSKIDIRTDVYSLGVVLYQMLTGKFPYEVVGNMRDVLGRIIGEAPQRPRALRREMNDEVETIILKCLAKEPERRYQSAGELGRDVQRYLNGEPIEAKRDSPAYVLRKQLSKHKLLVAIAAAFLLVVFAGLAASLTFWRQAADERDIAQAARLAEAKQRQIAAKRAEETSEVADFQAEMLSGLDLAEMAATLRDDLIAEVRLAKKARGLPPEQIESETTRLTDELSGANLTNVALNSVDAHIIRPALTAIRERFADKPAVQAALFQTVSETYRTFGLYDEALPPQTQALEIRRRALGEDHPDTLNSLNNLGVLLSALGKLDEAESRLRGALDRGRRALGEDHLETLFSMHALGLVLHRQGKSAEAESMFRAALDGRRRALGDEDQETVASINYLGTFLMQAGKYAEAEPLLEEALERGRRVFGPKHIFTLMAINNMGVMLRNQGRLEQAEPYLTEVVQLCRETFGDDHPHTGSTIYNLAKLFELQGKYDEAEQVLRQALERARTAGGDDAQATIRWLGYLGNLLEAAGNFAEAETCFREVVERYEAWHTAEPDGGYDAKAAEWRAKLEALDTKSENNADSEGSMKPEP